MRQSRNATSGDVIQLLSDICRQAGFKLTRQRVAVLRELAHSGDGATVDRIHLRLQARLPTLSRETVRRTLGALERFGIVHEIRGPDEVARPSARASSGRASPERKRVLHLRVSSKRR
jgi:Fur family peroxide stress response transcriptional regulator